MYRIYSNWGSGSEDQILTDASFRNIEILIFLFMLAKFVRVKLC